MRVAGAQGAFDFPSAEAEFASEPGYLPVFRPVQYLGNKLRTLPLLQTVVAPLLRPGISCCDVFSGTSVVSQALARWGGVVTAIDSQPACQTMAAAMLGVDRLACESVDATSAEQIVKAAASDELHVSWADDIEREATALKHGDTQRLLEIYRAVPLIWRSGCHDRRLLALAKARGLEAFGIGPLFASMFAGTYFGIHQALQIDSLRVAIEIAYRDCSLEKWSRQAYLTALLSAASAVVHSAGKHFAQPLTAARSASGSGFRAARLLQDRSIDVFRAFVHAAGQIGQAARGHGEGHIAIGAPIENCAGYLSNRRPSLVYADPPYTAQQYSRFYHALDTLVAYRVPFMEHGTRITTGLYPVDRFKSAFCSKRRAPQAFDNLVQMTRHAGSRLLLSYSSSDAGSDGNDRMIALQPLMEICRRHYSPGAVTVIRLDHTYRQFNSRDRSNELRRDPEMLIFCEV